MILKLGLSSIIKSSRLWKAASIWNIALPHSFKDLKPGPIWHSDRIWILNHLHFVLWVSIFIMTSFAQVIIITDSASIPWAYNWANFTTIAINVLMSNFILVVLLFLERHFLNDRRHLHHFLSLGKFRRTIDRNRILFSHEFFLNKLFSKLNHWVVSIEESRSRTWLTVRSFDRFVKARKAREFIVGSDFFQWSFLLDQFNWLRKGSVLRGHFWLVLLPKIRTSWN